MTKILGASSATAEQMAQYLLSRNKNPRFSRALTAREFCRLYLEICAQEDVRGDVAFAQACKETGFFCYGGDVSHTQNNFAGLGATGGIPGCSFDTIELGILAQAQHLKSYATKAPLNRPCADPRRTAWFMSAKGGSSPDVETLGGSWAVPGYDTKRYRSLEEANRAQASYGYDILRLLREMTATEVSAAQGTGTGSTAPGGGTSPTAPGGETGSTAPGPGASTTAPGAGTSTAAPAAGTSTTSPGAETCAAARHSLPSNPANYGYSRGPSSIRYLIYHYTGNRTDSAAANASYFKNNVVKASAHYFVDDNSIYQSVDDLKNAYSVGGSRWSDCALTGGGSMYGKITNANSISIEMCSRDGVITAATLANAVALGGELMEKYHIPLSNVYRHFDVNGKHCPGWPGWYGADSSKWLSLKAGLPSASPLPYLVKPLEDLNVRASPNGPIVIPDGAKRGILYTVVEESGAWGRLKSGAGWICVSDKYVTRHQA